MSKPLRIAIGQLWQESNTFNPVVTTRQNFEEFGVLRGPELIEKMYDTNELGGFIQSLRAWPEQPEIVPMLRLPAWPSGRATAETFDWLRSEVVASLQPMLPVDAVLLALHGAMVASKHPDVEGEILQAVRELVGPKVPIVATLDLHANVTDLMVRMADALVLFHTAPHIDVYETGVRGAKVLRRILIDGAKPKTAFVKLPLVVPAERANTENPESVSQGFKHKLQELEGRPNVLTAGLATVQPWLDIPELGTSVVVTTDDDAAAADRECRALASEVWQRRREYIPELTPVEVAVRIAHETPGGLVVLSDSADATTSGACGDSTWVLRELLKYQWPRPALVTLVSPEAVAAAECGGNGARMTLSLGGLRDSIYSTPLDVEVEVVRMFDADLVISGHLGRNLAVSMGRSAVLRNGNVHIIATSRSGPHFAPELFQKAGLDPFAASVLIAKSPCGFRAAYAPRAVKILVVKAPGCAPSDFWNYDYREIQRPLWPWDEIEDEAALARR